MVENDFLLGADMLEEAVLVAACLYTTTKNYKFVHSDQRVTSWNKSNESQLAYFSIKAQRFHTCGCVKFVSEHSDRHVNGWYKGQIAYF